MFHKVNFFSMLLRFLAFILGIIFLSLSLYGANRAYKRLWLRIPCVQEASWENAYTDRKLLTSSQVWLDSRPLVIFAGDSHIEMGSWYQWMLGKHAIRNCGMSTARIEHVGGLIASLSESSIDTLLMHCGINNLTREESPVECLTKYKKILDQAAVINPRRIIVVPVMPLRQSPVDTRARECNLRVRMFNSLLVDHCKARNIPVLDLGLIVTDDSGGLKSEFTDDGLHLNPRGYAAVTPAIERGLSTLR